MSKKPTKSEWTAPPPAETPAPAPTPAPQPAQPQPWFVTRDEQIRLKALELAVQTQGNPNKVTMAREYMKFLKPEEDVEV